MNKGRIIFFRFLNKFIFNAVSRQRLLYEGLEDEG